MPISIQPELIKTFDVGLNHQTHLISSGKQQTVLKLFTQPNSSAIFAQKLAANHQLAPMMLYVNQVDDVVLMDYIDTKTVSQPIHIEDLTSLASALNQLHSLPTNLYKSDFSNFDLLKYYDAYLANIDNDYAAIRSTHQELTPIIKIFLEDKTEWCLCHNDLVRENCFITESGAKFIDWEYAQINHPWFDLATLIYSLKLDLQQVTRFIQAYNRQWLASINTPVYYSAMISMLWCDILWYLARNQTTESINLENKMSDLHKLKDLFNSIAI